jgi:hypothetical protein
MSVMAPIFGHENDELALKILQEATPDRNVAGINCRDLVYGLGTIHCISQQQPAPWLSFEATILNYDHPSYPCLHSNGTNGSINDGLQRLDYQASAND